MAFIVEEDDAGYQEDIQRAIELSLREAGGDKPHAGNPKQALWDSLVTAGALADGADYDAEMAAALKASMESAAEEQHRRYYGLGDPTHTLEGEATSRWGPSPISFAPTPATSNWESGAVEPSAVPSDPAARSSLQRLGSGSHTSASGPSLRQGQEPQQFSFYPAQTLPRTAAEGPHAGATAVPARHHATCPAAAPDPALQLLSSSPGKHARGPSLPSAELSQPLIKRSRPASDSGASLSLPHASHAASGLLPHAHSGGAAPEAAHRAPAAGSVLVSHPLLPVSQHLAAPGSAQQYEGFDVARSGSPPARPASAASTCGPSHAPPGLPGAGGDAGAEAPTPAQLHHAASAPASAAALHLEMSAAEPAHAAASRPRLQLTALHNGGGGALAGGRVPRAVALDLSAGPPPPSPSALPPSSFSLLPAHHEVAEHGRASSYPGTGTGMRSGAGGVAPLLDLSRTRPVGQQHARLDEESLSLAGLQVVRLSGDPPPSPSGSGAGARADEPRLRMTPAVGHAPQQQGEQPQQLWRVSPVDPMCVDTATWPQQAQQGHHDRWVASGTRSTRSTQEHSAAARAPSALHHSSAAVQATAADAAPQPTGAADRRMLLNQRVWWWEGPGQAQLGRITAIDRRAQPLLYTVRIDPVPGAALPASLSSASIIATADCLLPFMEHGERLMCRLAGERGSGSGQEAAQGREEPAAAAGDAQPGSTGGDGGCAWAWGRLEHCVFNHAVPMVAVRLYGTEPPCVVPYEWVVPVADAAEGSGCVHGPAVGGVGAGAGAVWGKGAGVGQAGPVWDPAARWGGAVHGPAPAYASAEYEGNTCRELAMR